MGLKVAFLWHGSVE